MSALIPAISVGSERSPSLTSRGFGGVAKMLRLMCRSIASNTSCWFLAYVVSKWKTLSDISRAIVDKVSKCWVVWWVDPINKKM